MYVLDVIPIAKAIGRETLTYFTSERLIPGTLVSVPLRARKVQAIVTAAEDVRSAKSRIRSLEHELRRIEGLEATRFLLPSFIDAAIQTARFAATTTGSVIFDLVPKQILEHAREIADAPIRDRDVGLAHPERPTVTGEEPRAPEPELVQTPRDERMTLYRRLIRESFADEKSTVVLAPTVYLARELAHTLSKGIEQYTVLIHSELTARSSLVSLWRRALAEPHPLLIVGTAGVLGIPRHDIAVFILEAEESRNYKRIARPFLDIRQATEEVSRARRARFVLGSASLRTETLYRAESGEVHALTPPTLRPPTTAHVTLIDMTKKNTPLSEAAARSAVEGRALHASHRAILSEEAEALIHRSVERNERVLVFALRRGLAPTTICGDCERVVLCRRCSAALVLHRAPRRNIFRCHRCSLERDAHETCLRCGGWKLVALGVGTEGIADTVHTLVPRASLTLIDSDTTPTDARAEKAMQTFLNSRTGVLVSTEMALPHLRENIEYVIVASLDALLTLPDFRMNERIFHLLLSLRSRALKTFIIQTRSPEHRLFEQALTGHMSDFYREELAERKRFGYPPFTTLVKISRAGSRETLIKNMEHLKTTLAGYAPIIYPAPTDLSRGKTEMHALIKISRERWPDEQLLRLLSALPPVFGIDVNPESIL